MNEEKINVLVVADTYYPKVDGILRFVEEFTRRSKEQFNLSLLVPDLGVRKGQNVTYLETSKRIKVSGYPTAKFNLKNLRTIKKSINDNDIVFVQGPALISHLALFYGHKFKKKVVYYAHTIVWELFTKFFPTLFNKLFLKIIKKLSLRTYRYCDLILVPYYDLKQQLSSYGLQHKIKVARLGIDIDRFSPTKSKEKSKKKVKINPKKIVIGYVGRVSKEKNVLVLLEAFKKLKDQTNLQLLVVGDGPKELIDKFKEVKNCKVTGFVKNVEDYYRAMDLFVMPSLTETTSLATLEAMSSGLPVIVTKVGFMKHYVVKNHNGIFFPRDSSTMLSIKIEKLLKNEELRRNLSHYARRTVAYSFSWERAVNKIKRILMELYLK